MNSYEVKVIDSRSNNNIVTKFINMENSLLRKPSDFWKDTIESLLYFKVPNENMNIRIPLENETINLKGENANFNSFFYENADLSQGFNKENFDILKYFNNKNFNNNPENNSEMDRSEINSQKINLVNYSDKRKWTHEEDIKLLTLINNNQVKNWKKISEIIKTKSPQQCSYRYQKLSTKKINSNWNHKDDICLVELIETFGNDWEKIAKRLNKSVESIKERFTNKLNPKLKRSKFTIEEDRKVIELHEKFGNNWSEISKYLPERNALMIKNRFYSVLRKKILYNKKNLLDLFKINAKSTSNMDEVSKYSSDYKSFSREDNKSTITSKEFSCVNIQDNTLCCDELANSLSYAKHLEDTEEDQLKIDEICNYRYEKEFVDLDLYFDIKNEKEINESTNINQTKNDNVSNLRNSFNDELSSLQECLEMKKQEFSKECSVKMELDESSQDKNNLFNNEVLNNIDKRFKALLQDLVTLKKESNNDSKNLTKDLQKCKENILMELKILLELIDLLNNKMNLMN